MALPDCGRVVFRAPERSGAWWELARLKALFAPGARLLGYAARPGDFGFLAVREAQALRSVVVLERAVVAFDLPLCRGKLAWEAESKAEIAALMLECGALLHVMASGQEMETIESMDLAGVRIGSRAILFRTEETMARDAVSYVAERGGKLRHLVCGLAPGSWQVWWNGWLEEPGIAVEPGAGTLCFEAPEGSYFLRRL